MSCFFLYLFLQIYSSHYSGTNWRLLKNTIINMRTFRTCLWKIITMIKKNRIWFYFPCHDLEWEFGYAVIYGPNASAGQTITFVINLEIGDHIVTILYESCEYFSFNMFNNARYSIISIYYPSKLDTFSNDERLVFAEYVVQSVLVTKTKWRLFIGRHEDTRDTNIYDLGVAYNFFNIQRMSPQLFYDFSISVKNGVREHLSGEGHIWFNVKQ